MQHFLVPEFGLEEHNTWDHSMNPNPKVDQAQRIHHSIKSNRRTLFATVDPLCLIHPTTHATLRG